VQHALATAPVLYTGASYFLCDGYLLCVCVCMGVRACVCAGVYVCVYACGCMCVWYVTEFDAKQSYQTRQI